MAGKIVKTAVVKIASLLINPGLSLFILYSSLIIVHTGACPEMISNGEILFGVSCRISHNNKNSFYKQTCRCHQHFDRKTNRWHLYVQIKKFWSKQMSSKKVFSSFNFLDQKAKQIISSEGSVGDICLNKKNIFLRYTSRIVTNSSWVWCFVQWVSGI